MSDRELKTWTRRLTLGLLDLPEQPQRVTALRRDGLSLRLRGESASELHIRFHLQPGRDSASPAAEILQGPADDPQDRWARSILAQAQGLAPRQDWCRFLEESGGLRFSSGEAFALRITRRCNAACRFCNARGELHDLAEDEESRQTRLHQAVASGARLLSFTGGEPTLVPELAAWIHRARDAGIQDIELQTNGILLANVEKLDELCRAGLNHILLSLHAGRAEIHDAMLAHPGAFSAVEKMVGAARARGLAITVNCVICRENQKALDELVERLAAWGVPRLMLSYVSADALPTEELDLMPRLRQAARSMERAIQQGQTRGVLVRIPGLCGVPMCTLPPTLAEHFDEYDDERAAPRIPARRYAACCADCSLRPRCSGFWRVYLDRFGEDELQAR